MNTTQLTTRPKVASQCYSCMKHFEIVEDGKCEKCKNQEATRRAFMTVARKNTGKK